MALWGKKSNSEEPATQAAVKKAVTGEPEPQLSPEDMKKRASASAQLMLKFGEIVSVLMRSPQFRGLPLSQVEALVVPPVMAGQFLVAEAQSKSQGFVSPVAAALWANVSPEIDKRLSENLDQPLKLTANDWKSGDIPWLIILAGDSRIAAPMLKQLQEKALKGKPLKMRAKGKDGKVVVGNFTGETAPVAT